MAAAAKKSPEVPAVAGTQRHVTLPLTMDGVFKLMNGLQGLDFYEDSVGDRVIKRFYELGALRLVIAKNLTVLQRLSEDFEKSRVALARECAPKEKPEVGVKEGDPKWPRFQKEFGEMAAQEHETKLQTIDRAKLFLDKNPIPLLVLAALDPILIGQYGEDDEGEAATEG